MSNFKESFKNLTPTEFFDIIFNSDEFWSYFFECTEPDAWPLKDALKRNKLSNERHQKRIKDKLKEYGIEDFNF